MWNYDLVSNTYRVRSVLRGLTWGVSSENDVDHSSVLHANVTANIIVISVHKLGVAGVDSDCDDLQAGPHVLDCPPHRIVVESGQLSFERYGISDLLLHQSASSGLHEFLILALLRDVPTADELGVQRKG